MWRDTGSRQHLQAKEGGLRGTDLPPLHPGLLTSRAGKEPVVQPPGLGRFVTAAPGTQQSWQGQVLPLSGEGWVTQAGHAAVDVAMGTALLRPSCPLQPPPSSQPRISPAACTRREAGTVIIRSHSHRPLPERPACSCGCSSLQSSERPLSPCHCLGRPCPPKFLQPHSKGSPD